MHAVEEELLVVELKLLADGLAVDKQQGLLELGLEERRHAHAYGLGLDHRVKLLLRVFQWRRGRGAVLGRADVDDVARAAELQGHASGFRQRALRVYICNRDTGVVLHLVVTGIKCLFEVKPVISYKI